MAFSEEFFRSMELARRPVMDAAVRAFVAGPASEFIPRWYVMLFQIIRATEPALRRAASECGHMPWLHGFIGQKLEEETGHDELLLADLARVGVSAREAMSAPVNPWIAEMVGRQYYLIQHVHPAAYLGFIGLLEGFPPTLQQVDALQAASGFPAEAFSCARLHAKADIGHREELARVLDSVPAELQAAILENGRRCAGLQCMALDLLSQELPHG